MSVFGDLGLSAAERLERTVGPGVAIHSYKILMSDPDAAVVATATLCALRCAVLTRNEHETSQLITQWAERAAGRPGEAVEQLIARLLAEGRQRQARALCEAEAKRRPTARSAYLAARVSEQLGEHDVAHAHYRAAADLAEGDEEQPIAAAALARCLEIASERNAPGEELIMLAKRIPLTHASPAQKLLAAQVLLRQRSKYRRASALSTLQELATRQEPSTPQTSTPQTSTPQTSTPQTSTPPEPRGELAEVARAAVVLACRHADAMGAALSWVEAERIEACISHWPLGSQQQDAIRRLQALRDAAKDAAAEKAASNAAAPSAAAVTAVAAGAAATKADPTKVDAAKAGAAKTDPAKAATRVEHADEMGLARLRLLAERAPEVRRYLDRAEALLADAPLPTLPSAPLSPQVSSAQHALDALNAILRKQPDAALAALRHAWSDTHGAPTPALWSALLWGLRAAPPLRAQCVTFFEKLLRSSNGTPPRGYMPYALALRRAGGHDALALATFRAAHAAAEPEARKHYAAALTARGWQLASRGWQQASAVERDAAIRLLREAKALSQQG